MFSDVEGEAEEELSDDTEDTLTDPELDVLDPEEKKIKRKIRREEKVFNPLCQVSKSIFTKTN